jgi:hypothetical protein
MVQKKTIGLSLICIILATGFTGTYLLLNKTEVEIQVKSEELVEIENEKNSLQVKFSNLQSIINELEAEKDNLENQKLMLESEKGSLKTQVLALELETDELDDEVDDLEDKILDLENEVSELEVAVIEKYNLGYSEGESIGYQNGYDEGYIEGIEFISKNGFSIIDPNYNQVISFVDSDKTDQNEYSFPDYVCYDFTADLSNNAFESGYRCGFVYIEFHDGAHAIVCFNTTDQGLVYVEPQTDEIVEIDVGQPYLDQMIIDIGIIW